MLSREMVRECSDAGGGGAGERESQLETREKDFFFRRGGCGGWRMRGRGGGGRSSRRGDFGGGEGKEVEAEDEDEDEKVAEASVKDFRRLGMWTVFFGGAVLGRWSERRSANEGLSGGVDGIGSASIRNLTRVDGKRGLP